MKKEKVVLTAKVLNTAQVINQIKKVQTELSKLENMTLDLSMTTRVVKQK